MKNEYKIPTQYILFFSAILIIAISHLIPLIKNQLPLNWDAGFYFYYISEKIAPLQNNLEPLYFYLAQALAVVFGVIKTIKFIQYVSIIIFAVSTYFFISKYYSKEVAVLIMLVICMIPGTSRIWADQYRNMLALSVLPIFLWSVLHEGHSPFAIIILSFMALTHRFIFVFVLVSYIIYLAIQLFRKEYKIVTNGIAIVFVTLLLASPYLYSVFLPSVSNEVNTLLKWEQAGFNIPAINMFSSYYLFFGLCGAVYIMLKPTNNQNLLLLVFFGVAFILVSGLFGTPFLLYERYMLLCAIMSVLISSAFFQGIKEGNYHKYLFPGIAIISSIIVLFFGYTFINQLSPFITNQEFAFLQNVSSQLPENSTLLIPSREYYWAKTLTKSNVVALEWYELLGQRNASDEVAIITSNNQESPIYVNKIKEKYNTTELYFFFTSNMDPVIPQNIFAQPEFAVKMAGWIPVINNGVSYLFKL